MTFDVVTIAGVVMIALGWLLRNKVNKGGKWIDLIGAALIGVGVFIVLEHTIVPAVMTIAAPTVAIEAGTVTAIIFVVLGLALYGKKRGGGFASIYMGIGAFLLIQNLLVPYIATLSDWSFTQPLGG